MLIRPQHPERFDPLATNLSVPRLWLPSMGITQRGMGWLPCCCCNNPCDTAEGSDCCLPQEYNVNIPASLLDDNCGDCTGFAGDYIVSAVGNPCNFLYSEVACGGSGEFNLFFSSFGGVSSWQVNINYINQATDPDSTTGVTWSKDPVTCAELLAGNISLPYAGRSTQGAAPPCSFPVATPANAVVTRV